MNGLMEGYTVAMNNKEVQPMEWKRARVSGKRQVTIPQKMYEQTGIKDEVEFAVQGNQILLRPVREYPENDHFADLILADLIEDGYEGNELLTKFREKQEALRDAVNDLIKESGDAAGHFDKENDQTKELFGDVMKN